MRNILLQVVMDTAALTGMEQGPTEEKLSLISLLAKGGWLMIPIILLAIIAVYIFFERYLIIKRSTKIDSNFMNKIRDLVKGGNLDGAKTLCMSNESCISKMIEKGLSRLGNPLKDISASIENVANLEVFKLEKKLPILATIAGASPMLGFLGTVVGMIDAFYRLSMAGGNNVDPGMLAGGIYSALVTTATGLTIGILAYIGYNVLTSMVKKAVFNMEANSVEFIDLLHEPA